MKRNINVTHAKRDFFRIPKPATKVDVPPGKKQRLPGSGSGNHKPKRSKTITLDMFLDDTNPSTTYELMK